jgi:protease-4
MSVAQALNGAPAGKICGPTCIWESTMKNARTKWVWVLALVSLAGAVVPVANAERTLLRLRLNGPLVDAPSDSQGLMALLANEKINTLRDLVSDIRAAGRDNNIDGLVLVIETPQYSLSQAEEIIAAIKDFKSQNKPVYCYMDVATNLSYALAANCDHVTLAEFSELFIIGLHAEQMYFKGLLDKIGVEMQGMHCGDYKSALEPFTRKGPSDAAAENINWLLDGLYERWLTMMAEGRGISTKQMEALVNEAPLTSADALEQRLVDQVASFPAFRQMLHKEFGDDVKVMTSYKKNLVPELDTNNPFTLFTQVMSLFEPPAAATGPAVGLIHLQGPIVVGSKSPDSFGEEMAFSATLRSALVKAREDDDLKAVVLRIDSPGGSALASDIIWKAATELSQEKPLIVSMGSVAASGGYYTAVPGDVIFANPSTITASIGVVGGKPILRGLFEEKLGITTVPYTRGKHADMMSTMRPWDDSEQKWLRTYLDEVYDQFKDRIRTSRGQRLKKELDEMAGGRVFTGEQALKLGLVDKLGGLVDALDYAAKKADLGSDYRVQPVPGKSELAVLVDMLHTLSEEDRRDDFQVSLQQRIAADPLLSGGLSLLSRVAPHQVSELKRAVQNLEILQREHVGCFLPSVPQIR